ncbi:MAG: thymidine phosphorylase [Candidatus Eisenbacteria bacterium]|nr:thymidine phosphorylase [Candidatus Eisenbacteria bacterium]
MFTAKEIITKKRSGIGLSDEEIRFFIKGVTTGEIPDYQVSAFLMATYLKGMSFEETKSMTLAMMNSGNVFDLSRVSGVKADKHSTGGVGDKVSLILAPLLASCGIKVPMISGRGLGHTGGTLDKLESIPGMRTRLTRDEFITILEKVGCVMSGQTDEVVPADRKMYALRDVTGTVESLPLIVSSILSKKLAAGPEVIVFDVKSGNGAFMRSENDAVELANLLVKVSTSMNRKACAYITDMSQPLGKRIGNSLEVGEALEMLRGGGPPDLVQVTLTLCAEILKLSGKESTYEDASRVLRANLGNGSAFEKFRELVKLQDGDVRAIDNPSLLPSSKVKEEVRAEQPGYLTGIDTKFLGDACALIGAGRRTAEDEIDPAAGMVVEKRLGDSIRNGDVLITVFAESRERIASILPGLKTAFKITPEKIQPPPLIRKVVRVEGVEDWKMAPVRTS